MVAVAEVVALVVLAVALVRAARADLERRVIPNGCSAAVAASGLASALLRALDEGGPAPVARSALGATVVLGVMVLATAASRRLSGRAGVGGGDVKLLCAAGAWTGPAWGLAVVAGACATSLALSGAEYAFRRLTGHKAVIYRLGATAGGIPLGPGIALTTLTVVLLGRL